jgi:hypothetical protein
MEARRGFISYRRRGVGEGLRRGTAAWRARRRAAASDAAAQRRALQQGCGRLTGGPARCTVPLFNYSKIFQLIRI